MGPPESLILFGYTVSGGCMAVPAQEGRGQSWLGERDGAGWIGSRELGSGRTRLMGLPRIVGTRANLSIVTSTTQRMMCVDMIKRKFNV